MPVVQDAETIVAAAVGVREHDGDSSRRCRTTVCVIEHVLGAAAGVEGDAAAARRDADEELDHRLRLLELDHEVARTIIGRYGPPSQPPRSRR